MPANKWSRGNAQSCEIVQLFQNDCVKYRGDLGRYCMGTEMYKYDVQCPLELGKDGYLHLP
jgi:hypothetical protein